MLLRRFAPMTNEQTQALDDADKTAGEAFHQQGLRTRAQDQAWRRAAPEELQPRLQETGNLQIGEPTEGELKAWAELGLLPVGRGGRPVTMRKPKDIALCNVQEDTQEFERKILHEAKKWIAPAWKPARPLSDGAKFVLIFFSGHRRDGDLASHMAAHANIMPIPIDLAVHDHFGNVMHDHYG